jgi:hypothetical protein
MDCHEGLHLGIWEEGRSDREERVLSPRRIVLPSESPPLVHRQPSRISLPKSSIARLAQREGARRVFVHRLPNLPPPTPITNLTRPIPTPRRHRPPPMASPVQSTVDRSPPPTNPPSSLPSISPTPLSKIIRLRPTRVRTRRTDAIWDSQSGEEGSPSPRRQEGQSLHPDRSQDQVSTPRPSMPSCARQSSSRRRRERRR